MTRPFDLTLYLVTDPALGGGRPLIDTVARAVAGGVTLVQLRDPTAHGRAMVAEARALKAMLAPLGVPLIINDRVDVAVAADADGVHVGQDDLDPVDVRAMIGPDRILGLSVGSPAELAGSAAALGAVDYLGTGPIRGTATKADAGRAIGTDGFAALRALTALPMVAIGGIGVEAVASCVAAGADGVAVVSAIMAAPDPEAAARVLRAAVAGARPRGGRTA